MKPPPGSDAPGEGATAQASTPRWVKVFGLIALVIVALAVVLVLLSGHDPGRHAAGTLWLAALALQR